MAEITLGDYTGYILLEMIKAREMADAYSRVVAERYASDEVMRHFAVPRFKVPKMQLTIPVLISGARFRQTVRFDFTLEDFIEAMQQRAEEVRARLTIRRPGFPPVGPVRPDGPVGPTRPGGPGRPPLPSVPLAESRRAREVESIAALAVSFHAQLAANPDPLRPDTIVTVMWERIFWAALGIEKPEDVEPDDDQNQADRRHAVLVQTTQEVLDMVRARTVIDSTAIDSLLINPETHIVKDGSNDSSVFTVSAELLEEAFYLRSVREEGTERTTTIVEFE